MISIFIYVVIIFTPVLLIYLNFNHQDFPNAIWFSIFIVVAMTERVWETFYTPRGKDVRKFHGDWTLPATIIGYYITTILLILHFFTVTYKNPLYITIGFIFFISATIMRIRAVQKLGAHWNIHLVPGFISSNQNIVKEGPYGLVRHPIYLAAFLELIGLAFISSGFFYIIVIIFFNLPLYVWRSLFEERQNLLKFGNEYGGYKKIVPFMFPYKLFVKKTAHVKGIL